MVFVQKIFAFPMRWAIALVLSATSYAETVIRSTIDPMSRCIRVTYTVPANASNEVLVRCEWMFPGTQEWRTATVQPLVSETALNLVDGAERNRWMNEGRIIERRAAGIERTVVFNPYPEAQQNGLVNIDFRVTVSTMTDETLSSETLHIEADNSDVMYIEDWSKVINADAIESLAGAAEPRETSKWAVRSELGREADVTLGNGLYGTSLPNAGLPRLAYPLNLHGTYAIYVCTSPGKGSIGLRLSDDERTDTLSSRRIKEEVLWRWTDMARRHLVLSQPHQYTGYAPAHVDYVKLTPLSKAVESELAGKWGGEPDKIVAGYFEPYSWAFYDNIQETVQHRQPLTAYVEGRVPMVDIQIGRFGMKVVYESRLTDQLLHATIGDPIGDVVQPTTDNVGRMQQFTNTLDAELRYAREMGLQPFANFGASNCYVGTPLQGDISKQHPDWLRGSMLRFEVSEVRSYALSLYQEALDIGAPGLTIDFCRYPETIDKSETCTLFLRELRALADEYGIKRGVRVPVMVRFPGTGVRLSELFDYATWVKEGLVDFLVPSNIQGRHMHIDMKPYLDALQGSSCTLLPCVDGLSWGLPMPGPFLWRVKQLYDMGASGVYIYQADGRLLNWPDDRRTMRLPASSAAINAWWEDDARIRPQCSKGIYITPPSELGVNHGWERIRIWLEGIAMGDVDVLLDDSLVSRFSGPPYLVGSEEYSSDGVVPAGKHTLLIRAKDGDGWLEQRFDITGAG